MSNTEKTKQLLSSVLNQHGLFDPKWSLLFASEHITTTEDIQGNESRLYSVLKTHATSDVEIVALRNVLGIEDSEFEQKLMEAGLSHVYIHWCPKFEEIGVTSLQQLQHLYGDSLKYSELTQCINFDVEKRALWALLKMDEAEKDAEASRKKRKEEAERKEEELRQKCRNHEESMKEETKKRKEEAEKLLQEMKNLSSETKNRHDERVKQIEDKIRDVMNIHPKSWISEDKSLPNMIDEVETNINKLFGGEMEVVNVTFSDDMLIKYASGGLALQGILITKNLNDPLQPRDYLLRISEKAQFAGPTIDPVEDYEEFSSKVKENQHKQSMSSFGCSLTATAKFPAYAGAVVEASATTSILTESNEVSETHRQSKYHSKVKHCIIPMRSYSFQLRDIELSSNAIDDLMSIESVMVQFGSTSIKVQKECEKFFTNYGSHVSRGPINFGGIYWWTCSSEGFFREELSSVQNLQSVALSTKVGVAYGGIGASAEVNIEDVKGDYRGQFRSDALSKTQLIVSKTGGPAIISDLETWKKGLESSNSTWSVIDRSQRFTPIWDVIELNYCKEFAHVTVLVKVLRKGWEKMTGLRVTSHELIDILEEVSSWCKEAESGNLEEHLDRLLKLRKSLGDSTSWADWYLSETIIQDFLKCVISNYEHMSDSSWVTILKLRQLISFEDLSILTPKEFKEKVQNLLYEPDSNLSGLETNTECYDIEDVIKHFEKAREMILIEEQEEEATTIVATAVYTLRSHFHDQMYHDLFILTLIFPFTRSALEHEMINKLSKNDLTYLCTQLKEQNANFNKFKSMSKLHIQAYLFKLTVSMYQSSKLSSLEISETRTREHMKYMEEKMSNELEGPIAQILDIHLNSLGVDMWNSMHNEFDSLLQKVGLSTETNGKPLAQILNMNDTTFHGDQVASPADPVTQQVMEDSKAYEMFKTLDILKFYPQKLGISNCTAIQHKSPESAQCTDPKRLLLFILHKIMMYDVRFRKVLLKHDDSKPLVSSNKPIDDIFAEDDIFTEDSPSETTNNQFRVNPQDCLLAALSCADDFLRQDLMARVANCQFAVPFILPDPFTHDHLTVTLWGLRSIIKEWKTSNNLSVEQRLSAYPMPIITFLRLSENEISKSQIMNSVISSSSNDNFFHRFCDGGNITQLLRDGLVDLCWYLPAGNKDEDAFPDAVAFLNLHGNANDHVRQTTFLSEISSMCVILLKDEDINDKGVTIIQQFSRSPGGILLLRVSDKQLAKEKVQKLKEAIPNATSVIQSLVLGNNPIGNRKKIISKIYDKWTYFQMKTLEQCLDHAPNLDSIWLDEGAIIQEAKKLAAEFQAIVDSSSVQQRQGVKHDMLPLQGEKYWQAWAKLDRKQFKEVESDISTMEVRKSSIRRAQLCQAENLTPLMASFLSSLLTCQKSVRRYYLQFLKLYLDDLSRKCINDMEKRHQEELQQCNGLSSEKIKQCKKQHHEALNRASFGLEHVLREVGQVYEAAKQHYSTCNCLPQVAAEFLVDGYPLELLDGDTSHVPLTWVRDVLERVDILLNSPRIFVLSVLGLQSTGKSTLLNVTFGLQFTVSAGRCTRGAYMQLLPISEELRAESDFNCDYLLVVDTEGLRAPELDTDPSHDNELASFVIGLANVTMINIKVKSLVI